MCVDCVRQEPVRCVRACVFVREVARVCGFVFTSAHTNIFFHRKLCVHTSCSTHSLGIQYCLKYSTANYSGTLL